MTPTDEAKKLVADAHAKCPSDHAVACDSGLICCDCAQALVTRLLADKERLTEACQEALDALDNHYDVDQPIGGPNKEFPFTGAGALMQTLQETIKKVSRP